MKRAEQLIGVLPMGPVANPLPQVIAAHVQGYFRWPATVIAPAATPDQAYDNQRDQFDAGIILSAMEKRPSDRYIKIIAVMEADIFLPIFTHVFGEARQGGKYGLVSVFRLKRMQNGTVPTRETIAERAAKVALHELGHLYNLVHCDDQRCLMHFSENLETLDQLPFMFCRYCRTFIDTQGKGPQPDSP